MTDYVREGYNRALSERRFALGFLMILMQRLVTSSTRAIRTSLERRLATLTEAQRDLAVGSAAAAVDVDFEDPEADTQAALEEILQTAPEGLNERTEVGHLLKLARRVEADGPDSKALTLLELMRGFRQAEENPDLKFLIFTEFVPTQDMLTGFLMSHGFRVTYLNGKMNLEERRSVQAEFAGPAQVLISTDAGGEGLNLQFCHIIINFLLPWNPMRIEQRIGRVDRIGQTHEVNAVNLVFEGTVEFRVREVLEQKLATILAEFGVDKSSDVLESVEAGAAFDRLYADVVVNPESAGARVDALIADLRTRASSLRSHARLLQGDEDRTMPLDPEPARAVMNHPLPAWVESLVLSFLAEAGGSWSQEGGVYTLIWPDGFVQQGVFEPAEASRRGIRLLSIQDSRIRHLALALPALVPGQAVPYTEWPGLSASIEGVFAIFRVALEPSGVKGRKALRDDDPRRTLRILPLFLHTDGRILPTTVRHLIDKLIESPPPVSGHIAGSDGDELMERIAGVAREQGLMLYHELTVANGDPEGYVPRLEPLVVLAIRRGAA